MGQRICSIDGCNRPFVARGVCELHYRRILRHGDPFGGKRRRPGPPIGASVADRFEFFLPSHRDPLGCWVWQGARFPNGYGQLKLGRVNNGAHVVSWELANNRAVPAGLVVRHICDNPPCVNPEHLVIGTHQDNSDDQVARSRQCRGSRNKASILTEGQVLEIRRLCSAGHLQRDVAATFGVNPRTVSAIMTGVAWTHI